MIFTPLVTILFLLKNCCTLSNYVTQPVKDGHLSVTRTVSTTQLNLQGGKSVVDWTLIRPNKVNNVFLILLPGHFCQVIANTQTDINIHTCVHTHTHEHMHTHTHTHTHCTHTHTHTQSNFFTV